MSEIPDDGPHLARWKSPDDPPPLSYVMVVIVALLVCAGGVMLVMPWILPYY